MAKRQAPSRSVRRGRKRVISVVGRRFISAIVIFPTWSSFLIGQKLTNKSRFWWRKISVRVRRLINPPRRSLVWSSLFFRQMLINKSRLAARRWLSIKYYSLQTKKTSSVRQQNHSLNLLNFRRQLRLLTKQSLSVVEIFRKKFILEKESLANWLKSILIPLTTWPILETTSAPSKSKKLQAKKAVPIVGQKEISLVFPPIFRAWRQRFAEARSYSYSLSDNLRFYLRTNKLLINRLSTSGDRWFATRSHQFSTRTIVKIKDLQKIIVNHLKKISLPKTKKTARTIKVRGRNGLIFSQASWGYQLYRFFKAWQQPEKRRRIKLQWQKKWQRAWWRLVRELSKALASMNADEKDIQTYPFMDHCSMIILLGFLGIHNSLK